MSVEEFWAKVWMQQRSVLSSHLFTVVVDVVSELARDGVYCCMLMI